MKYLKALAALVFCAAFLGGCTEENTVVAPPVDHLAPSIEWIAPESGAELAGTVELTFTAYDEGGISRLNIYRNGFSPPDWSIPASQDTLYTISWDTREVEDDVYILEARAWDESGNIGISPSLVVRIKNNPDPPPEDHTPPDVWWVAPEAGSTLQDTVRLQVRVFDESGVDSARLLKDGVPIIYLPPAPRGGTEGGVEYLWDTRLGSDGVHIWEARAWDSVGNMGISPALLVRVKNNPDPPPEDHTPPVVVWRSPEPGSEVEGTVELRFQVMDDAGLDTVEIYLNGRIFQKLICMGNFFDGRVTWVTNEMDDGNYIVQVRASDGSGNVGYSPVIYLTVQNDRPRVIWVPDDFETIQEAIDASQDGDTVRVRPGIYEGDINFWDKNIWLESSDGPEVTIIDATLRTWGVLVDGEQDTTSGIRGFAITNAEFWGIGLDYRASPKILNNIISLSGSSGIRAWINRSVIRNNVLTEGWQGIDVYLSYGEFDNNIVIHTRSTALWNASALANNPLVPDYNLIWDYQRLMDSDGFTLGPNNIIDHDPLFVEGSFILRNYSPCLDMGRPDLLDLDGSRSDIGCYGGPYAYPIP